MCVFTFRSTIVALLQRFYDVQEGRVLLDGHDYKDLKLSSLHSHMAVVTQVTELFAGTIRENLVYGMPGEDDQQVPMADIEEACRQANAHDFIMQVSKYTHAHRRPTRRMMYSRQFLTYVSSFFLFFFFFFFFSFFFFSSKRATKHASASAASVCPEASVSV
jgi:hypothetical protein